MATPPDSVNPSDLQIAVMSDRRIDVEEKQEWVASFLKEVDCEGLLILLPDHFSWLTAGASARSILDPESMPALYFTAESRWLLCANVDTQRLFDEEIDSLGFQLKEWPWHLGRQQLLLDVVHEKKVACDVPLESCQVVADRLPPHRRKFTDYERACIRTLGQLVSHAVEATGRTLLQGETEREIAGQLSHRLLHRGVQPVMVTVAADGRSRAYRQGSFTSVPIKNFCILTAVARKYGLCVQTSRTISFGQADPQIRKEHDAACKVAATYIASTWPDGIPKHILTGGQRVFQLVGAENEFYLTPQGHLIGRFPIELMLTPRTEDVFRNHEAIVWNVSVGAAVSCDTFLITEEGAKQVTTPESWPLKRIRIQGQEFNRADILVR